MTKTHEIKIGSTKLSGLKSYEVERNKLWTDADRNMAGDLKATIIGVFPKITLQFNYLSESSLKTVLGLLEPAVLSVEYWDSYAGTYKTANYYAGDFKVPYFSSTKGLYAPFSVSLIPYKKT
jgi:hypothetical protein